MWKEKVRDNILGEVIDWKALIDSLKKERFTGYIKVESWDETDYVILAEGSVKKIVRHKDNKKTFLDTSNYTPSSESKISVYKSSPLTTAHICKDLNFFEYQTLSLSGYGEEIFHSELNLVNPEKLETFFQKVNLNGYAVIYTYTSIYCNVFLLQGHLVGINGGNTWDSEVPSQKDLWQGKVFLSAYFIEPDEVLLLISLKRGFKEKNELNGNGFFVNGNYVGFVENGNIKKGLLILPEEIVETQEVKGEKFLEVNLIENPERLEISFKDLIPKEEKKIKPDVPLKVREIFLDYIGPVGKILWDKVLQELDISPEEFTHPTFRMFINRLAQEIPEEDLSKEFLNKAWEVLDESTST
ncbi:hypothetical protein [Aquifex aeolicus]|uniref:Uncharacterized protein aq_1824 n=1 Tax=Aquifex aeolicus (strain VF5) TaxID=224324 RepID=Y1824_AQUAE|nr:hypothetical protein [Aquifex aeolicus]O67685.1 RecName: Full=Uncharacterized protein aq_1824 [Aquifex aeolicus VF5]AAC07657.1 putative protein [Aquifex aeolicus VF5]